MKLNKLNCPQCGKKTISYACSKGAGATCFYFCNDPSCGILITTGPASNISGSEGGDNNDFKIKEKIEMFNENAKEIKEELKGLDKDEQKEIFEMAKLKKNKIKEEKQSAGSKNSILAKIKQNKNWLIKNKTTAILDIVKCKQCNKNTIRFLSEKSLIAKMDTGWTEAKTVYYCDNCKSFITVGPAFSSEILGDISEGILDNVPFGDYFKAAAISSEIVNNSDNRLNGLMCSNCRESNLDIMSSAGFGSTAFYYCNNPKCGILIGTAPSSAWIREKRGAIKTINFENEELTSITGKIIDNRSGNFENKSKTIIRELSCPKCIKNEDNNNLRVNEKPMGKIVSKGYSGISGRIGMIGTSAQTQYICNKCKSLISIGPAFSLLGGSKKKKKTFKKKRKYKRTSKRNSKRINKRTKRKRK